MLAVPGSSERFIEKSRGLPVDALFLDLEDAVAPEAKGLAREQAAAAVRAGDRSVLPRAIADPEGLAAGKPLKSRSGPEFADLEEIAVKVMQRLMKSDWEGDELNYDSPQQMQQLLYCKLGLPVRRRRSTCRCASR